MVEMVVAMGVTAVVLVALISVMITGLYNTNLAKQTTIATDYVNEGLDWLRQERDKNWQVFYDKINALPQDGDGNPDTYPTTSGYCLSNLAFGAVGVNAQPNNPNPCTNLIPGTANFYRFMQGSIILGSDATSILDDEIQVKVVVRWSDSNGIHDAQSSARFTSWEAL